MAKKGELALLDRFLAGAKERVLHLNELATDLTKTQSEKTRDELVRDLHSIKGDAYLSGMSEFAQTAHATEDMLEAHRSAGTSAEMTALLLEGIDSMYAQIECRIEGVDFASAELIDLVSRLRKLPAPEAVGEQTEPAPDDEQPEPEPEPEPEPSDTTSPTEDSATVTEHLRLSLNDIDALTEHVNSVLRISTRNRQLLSKLEMLHGELVEVLRTAQTAGGNGHAHAHGPVAAQQTLEGLPKTSREMDGVLRELVEADVRMAHTQALMSHIVRRVRLQPLKTIVAAYPTFVRRCARSVGKQIRFSVVGDDLAVEKGILDRLADPCLHLLRNAIVHGVETAEERRKAGKTEEGYIDIVARQDGDSVIIEFRDDGAGFDLRAIAERAVGLGIIDETRVQSLDSTALTELAFSPGVSTAETVTQLAGRGVGLDVVKTAIEEMGGSIRVESSPGVGTRFILRVPVSIAMTDALLVQVCDQVFGIPQTAIVEVISLAVKDIRDVDGKEAALYRGELLSITRLREVLHVKGLKDLFANTLSVVVLGAGDHISGFVVDGFLGQREILVRQLGPYLGRPNTVAGASLLENDEILLMLQPADLVRATRDSAVTSIRVGRAARDTVTSGRRILYAEDSVITREYAANILRAQGFVVTEACDGLEALNFLEQEHFDALLTDLQMPRMDGWELLASVRRSSRYRNIPIIVLSTVENVEARQKAMNSGADVYMVKSEFTAEALVAQVRALLA